MSTFSKDNENPKPQCDENKEEKIEKNPLSKSLSDNLNAVRQLFSNCSDVVYREFVIDSIKLNVVLIFINELVDTQLINETTIPPIMNMRPTTSLYTPFVNIVDTIKTRFLNTANVSEIVNVHEVEESLLNGSAVLLVDKEDKALKIAIPGFRGRDISEPTIEKVIRGPKEGFTENISVNTAMLRKKIKSSKLKFENSVIGRQTKTNIHIAYLEGVVDEKVLKELRSRLGKIDVDAILESGYIEQLIQDTTKSIFPQILHTERPDRVAGAILEGRIAILIDGTPFVLIVPTTMVLFLQTSEDYSERYIIASFIRIVRFIFFIVSLLLPGLYVAIVSYHKEMVPTALLISIMESAKRVPFPVIVEALIMEGTFEALREAGIRLPIPANQTVGIVGALVIGDAAVKAGVISSIMVIIVSITAVASFGIPSYDMGYSIRVLRFILILLGGLFGLYGILLGLLIIFIHLVGLRSFGVNYLSPIAPVNLNELKDSFIRFPKWAMIKRPASAKEKNRQRQSEGLKPEPSNNDDEG
ncbi:spore germination protein [Clostridium fungisolvens]|uniref:Spore germination protein B1 n=1 Tax=Clostridium fungisolvens TaxID=1604897 RepID=A0A6V8SGH1_9CLOT|nr:spore germination protein [Clostridium fungisolvens]GFP76140.1 Spore germination protein B1 [Clostridium fungisolvens]